MTKDKLASKVLSGDTIAAAKHWVPILIALMAGIFSAYLSVKGLKKVWKPEPWVVVLIGAGFMAATYAVVNPLIAKHATSWSPHTCIWSCAWRGNTTHTTMSSWAI